MAPNRPFSVFRTEDQWLRATHERTALDTRFPAVQLAWDAASLVGGGVGDGGPTPIAAGLVFDFACRLYRAVPAASVVERTRWAAQNPLDPPNPADKPAVMFAPEEEAVQLGDFSSGASAAPLLAEPRGLAIDGSDRLYVADSKANDVLVFDLWTSRLLSRLRLPAVPAGALGPTDLAFFRGAVYAAVPALGALIRVSLHTEPTLVDAPHLAAPSRLAVSPSGEMAILLFAGTAGARVAFLDRPNDSFAVPSAGDIEFDGQGALLVAHAPGEVFRRFFVDSGAQAGPRAELPHLEASGYDGLGIVRTPDGLIAYFTERGLRYAVPARLRYARSGRTITYRLDAGEFQTSWGRVFLDACIPEGTQVRVACITADEPPDDPPVPWNLPANIASAAVLRPDLTPPLLPQSLAPDPLLPLTQLLHRRDTGRELPWVRMSAEEPFSTYEAPVMAGPGRYLWVVLELSGNTRSTPRVACLRAEHPGHDLLRKLPRVFSAEAVAGEFLRRFLAPFEGVLSDLEGKAVERRTLFEARSAPAETLPYLASFLGLALDERWSESVRRTLLEEATWLFRFRGTVPGLTRFLEICLGVRPVIIERFRLRGMGQILGEDPTVASAPVLGAGFRVGGAIGEGPTDPATAAATPDEFTTHAHRFSVVIPAQLSADEMDMVRHVLDVHRPAHTIVDVCTVDAGMRIGVGLHVGLTSILGRSGGFAPLRVGDAALGRGFVVGRPGGMPVGPTKLGRDSRVG